MGLKHWSLAGAAAVALLIQPANASAQTTGSRIGGTAIDVPDDITGVDRARYTMLKMGECMIRESGGGRARRFLKTFPNSEEAFKFARGWIGQDECLSSGDVTMQESHLRSAIYAAFYKQEYKLSGPGDIANAPAVDYADGQAIASLDEVGRQTVAIRQMGDCVVRADPVSAHDLISTEVNSEKERAAFRAITAKIPPCVVQGLTLKLNKLTLHGIIAESLYRLSDSVRIPKVAAAN